MNVTLKELNDQRKEKYRKDSGDEDFLINLNDSLYRKERDSYQNLEIEYPLLFIFGLPRSGTTLISQVIAHCFDVGYINNLASGWR